MKYKTTDYEKHLWRMYKIEHEEARKAEKDVQGLHSGFAGFIHDVYHRLYTGDQTPSGRSVDPYFERMFEILEETGDLFALTEHCVGDEDWTGLATTSSLNAISEHVENDQLDSENYEQALKFLADLLGKSTGEDKEEIESLINEAKKHQERNTQKKQEAIERLNEKQVEIRNAIRQNAQNVKERA